MRQQLSNLQRIIGYQFHDEGLLEHALTHSSYANERHWKKTRCNERLEFLGDAVLEIATSEFLFRRFPEMPEGQMTRLRASLVCEPTLDFCAREIALETYLLLGHGEELTGGRKRASVVSDALEAMIGAIYLDGGLANAKEFIYRFVLNDMEHKQLFYDSKTILQELVQPEYKDRLSYELLKEEGPDHNKTFESRVLLGDRELGRGTGRTKKAAEQLAAYRGLCELKKETPVLQKPNRNG
ncbi:MAG: ribonuclease III [Lachnospiraceae bacterium]|nr:ribonuclease III [Lachnospiraceae bacterium]